MNISHTLIAIAAVLVAPSLHAHGEEKHQEAGVTVGRDTATAQLNVSASANDAVVAVERLTLALIAGDMEKVSAELDPAVLILESGGAERSREEYLGGHAKSDAAFLSKASMTLKRRNAASSGDLAWVASESEIHAMKDDKMLMISSTETMVLRKGAAGWKIVHIHWSSRRAGNAH